mgnify:FL=1
MPIPISSHLLPNAHPERVLAPDSLPRERIDALPAALPRVRLLAPAQALRRARVLDDIGVRAAFVLRVRGEYGWRMSREECVERRPPGRGVLWAVDPTVEGDGEVGGRKRRVEREVVVVEVAVESYVSY